ncbi:sugar diacid utilization regulator [Saccharopolyspora lacisalsi]|uniref:Sugar diacid utilization regulator n=1 Tax=Halosaccharopolyspora lacisalsi TaxID=1000566 RepID=A0A839DV19_9PSEU|nr:helix-turn-helix domain-containing protein [Halosaccharopolyspora lacisalsi]MBA8823135.1 sugar diacid utilization regulator [Halosaccharopolyspora lacisalsi]
MLLRDLLDDRELGLVPLTGRQYLDRPIHGIYITDLIDPRRYLHGGELVLSGLVWHSEPADSERFAAALADAGVAGLAAGTARLGGAPPDLVQACARHAVPLVEVPLAVSFNTLSEHVLRFLRRDTAPRRDLVDAVAAGAELPRVLALAAEQLDTDCWVLSAAGTVVGTAELTERSRRCLVRGFLGSVEPPGTVTAPVDETGGAFVLWPVGSEAEPRAARWFVALAGDRQEWGPEAEAIAADLGTAVALLRSRLEEGRQAASRSVRAALHRLLDGSASPPEVGARLEAAGLPADEPLRVVAVEAGDHSEAATRLLREITAATGLAAVTAPLEPGALALLAADHGELAGIDERLRRVLDDVEHGGDENLVIGVSDISDTSSLRGAVEEARHARDLAAHRGGRRGMATAAELASHQVLLASLPERLRCSYRDRLLSPLIDYDRGHQSELVRTLRTFLEFSGSWSRCAQTLHVHVNTLRYRIRRIEEITGRDLTDFATRVDFYLALRLLT